MFGPRQRLRRIAASVLLMWLAAWTTAVLAGCMGQTPGRQAAPAVGAQESPVKVAWRGAAETFSHDSDQGKADGHVLDMPRSDNAPCLKFCSDGPSGLTSVKPSFDLPSLFAIAAPLAHEPFTLLHGQGHRLLRPLATALPWRVSVPIAYLRLTL